MLLLRRPKEDWRIKVDAGCKLSTTDWSFRVPDSLDISTDIVRKNFLPKTPMWASTTSTTEESTTTDLTLLDKTYLSSINLFTDSLEPTVTKEPHDSLGSASARQEWDVRDIISTNAGSIAVVSVLMVWGSLFARAKFRGTGKGTRTPPVDPGQPQ